MTKIQVEIEFDAPYPEIEDNDQENKNWLCPHNLQLVLRIYCKNNSFKVRDLEGKMVNAE